MFLTLGARFVESIIPIGDVLTHYALTVGKKLKQGNGQHLGCSLCEASYERELKAKKFSNKLKEILNKIDEVYPMGVSQSYIYYDWRYLHLIAKDLERGFIEKPEALSEAERYIDLIYNDIKNVPEELDAKKNAPPKPIVKT